MNAATIALILQLIPSVATLIEQITSNIELAKSSGVTEEQLQQLVTATTKLTNLTTSALIASMKVDETTTSTTQATA